MSKAGMLARLEKLGFVLSNLNLISKNKITELELELKLKNI